MTDLERHAKKKRLQSLICEWGIPEKQEDPKGDSEALLEEILTACEKARKLKNARFNDISHDANAVEIINQLDRVHQALTEGRSPSDYEQ